MFFFEIVHLERFSLAEMTFIIIEGHQPYHDSISHIKYMTSCNYSAVSYLNI